ncbi:MAG: hypothetical protein JSW20_06270 [Nitrospiraceae bacterium]|nr:MAG: hypothetical protein JSW20_06270 [Nitrospiraceae bacterium]
MINVFWVNPRITKDGPIRGLEKDIKILGGAMKKTGTNLRRNKKRAWNKMNDYKIISSTVAV